MERWDVNIVFPCGWIGMNRYGLIHRHAGHCGRVEERVGVVVYVERQVVNELLYRYDLTGHISVQPQFYPCPMPQLPRQGESNLDPARILQRASFRWSVLPLMKECGRRDTSRRRSALV